MPSTLARTGRPWVRHEGWLLKESGGPMSSYQPRYFVVAGGKLEYYKEESAKVSLKNAEGQSLGVTLQHSNIVTKVEAGLALQQKVRRRRERRVVCSLYTVQCLRQGACTVQCPHAMCVLVQALQEGDVVLGMNGDPLVQQLLQPAVERARRAGAAQSKCPPPYLGRCPSSAPAALHGTPCGSGRLGTSTKRPAHRAPSHRLGCSREPPPKSPIPPPLRLLLVSDRDEGPARGFLGSSSSCRCELSYH